MVEEYLLESGSSAVTPLVYMLLILLMLIMPMSTVKGLVVSWRRRSGCVD